MENVKMSAANADVPPPVQRKKSEKQRRLGPAPIASFEMSFDESTNNEVRSKVCKANLYFNVALSYHTLTHFTYLLCMPVCTKYTTSL